MSNYKNTLNLPQTDFPMKANLAQREPQILQKWAELDIYSQLRQKNISKKKFILHAGPPYANGHIHLGTATTTILKDIIVKSKILLGYDAPYVPGWDCHGLPIELNVEKKIGKPGRKVSPDEFRKACREYAQSFITIQRKEFQRLGVIADWEHPYLTMDFKYEADIIRSLAKIIANHHLQKGYKPIHWCLDCGSSLAEAEVEYDDKISPAIDVRFAVADIEDFWSRFSQAQRGVGPLSIPIWTTTPWSLPGNQAVALNPLLEYVLIECESKEQLLVAKDLSSEVMQRYKVKHAHILACTRGENLQGVLLKHPLYDKKVPVILSDHVTVESGTGAVHTAPAHGPDDYLLGKEYNLPLDNPVGDDGCYTLATPLFAGQFVGNVNDQIIAVLEKQNALIHNESIKHSYPHCWRHKSPIIFRATPQWFISMEKHGLRKETLEAIERVTWIPDWGKARIYGMVETRPDWCISRQRTWGVPLALFIHKTTGEPHPNTLQLMEEVAQKVEQKGISAWYDLDIKEFLGADADHYNKTTDVLDVWFDSGVSHECVLKVRPELKFPADIVLEGSDQHRGWFQSSLLTSIAINHEESYKEVLTHGFVVDGQGRKMSKSLGNVIAPEEIIQSLGADILRLWVASVDYRYEINASKEILNRMSDAYRRIRNTARFLLANLHGFDPSKHMVPAPEMIMLDRFAIDKARLLQEEIRTAYEAYQFHLITQKLHNFCASDMGSFYLDIIKDRQYTMPAESRGRRSAQTALYHIVQVLARWMAPVMSFTAEEIWQSIPMQTTASVFLSDWYEDLAMLPKTALMNEEYWQKIREVRDAVNKEIEKQRNLGALGSALEAEIYLYCAPNLKSTLDALGEELRFVLITSYAQVVAEHEGPADVIVTEVPGLALKVAATQYQKCERCWHRRNDVDANKDYPGICARCIVNITGPGEIRGFA